MYSFEFQVFNFVISDENYEIFSFFFFGGNVYSWEYHIVYSVVYIQMFILCCKENCSLNSMGEK